jgi:phage portal protein, SPP1 gp6-like
LKESIFAISMVANMTEADFGNSSGTALAFKLQAMDNLARMKDRKLQSAFNRLYKIVFSVPLITVDNTAWAGLSYTFTRNVPRNILEEAQIVGQLSGQVSEETKLSVLSIVDDPQKEIQRMEREEEAVSDLETRLEKQKIYSDTEINDSQKVVADVDQ